MTPTGWRCPKRVGFLFPHPCERSTPVGCQDCANGSIADPYRSRTDRRGYDDFDSGDDMEFTEADGVTLIRPRESFEDDLSAS